MICPAFFHFFVIFFWIQSEVTNIVLKSKINKRIKVEESPAFQQPITVYDPKGPAAGEFNAMVAEILRRIKKYGGLKWPERVEQRANSSQKQQVSFQIINRDLIAWRISLKIHKNAKAQIQISVKLQILRTTIAQMSIPPKPQIIKCTKPH